MQKRGRYILLLCLWCAFAPASAQYNDAPYFLQITESPLVIDNLLARGDSLYFKQQYDSSMYHYQKARIKSLYSGYGKGLIQADIGISGIYRQQGNYGKERVVLEQALSYCKIADNTIKYKAYIYNLMAVNDGYRGMYEKAVQSFEKAAELSAKYPLPQLPTALILNNLATMYSEMDMREMALGRLQLVDSILHTRPDAGVKVKNLWTYAYFYDKVFDFEKAKLYLDSLIPLADSLGDDGTRFMAYWKLADIALLQHHTKDAEYYLHKMEGVPADDIEPLLLKRKNTIAGRVYTAQKNYPGAIREYSAALMVAQQAKSWTEQADLYKSMAKIYAAMHQFDKAYQHVQLAQAYTDSVNKEKQARSIAAIEARYQSAQKDKAIAEKDKAIAQRELYIYKQSNAIKYRNIIISVAVFSVALLLAALYVVVKSYRQRQKLRDEKMIVDLREQELNQIKAMMDVEEQERTRIARDIHDGLMIKFSTIMMNLSALFDGDKEKDTYLEQLDSAITSLRNVAHNLMPDVLLEGGLAEAIYYFCENIKEEVHFEITFNFLNEIPRFDEKFELSVYRMVQELIQNIVKHAKATEAYIQIGYGEGLLHITIEDNGIGMDAKQKSTTGLGLKSIQNRMVALNGTMEISSEEGAGTSIVLEFIVEEVQAERGN